MQKDGWVRSFRADIDVLVETMARLRQRRKEWNALDLSTTLTDEDCGTSNKNDITNAITTWDVIETATTNAHFANLIRARQ